MRYHLTPVRMAKINKLGNSKLWRGCGEKGSPLTLLVGTQAGAAALENSVELRQEVKNRATLWLSNCMTRYLSKGYKHTDLKGHLHTNVYSNNVHNSQTMETAQMSINRWIDKEDVVYIYNGISLSHQKIEILPFATMWMEQEGIMLSEISQLEKDNYHMISLLCGI